MKRLWSLIGWAAFWVSWPALWVYLGGTKRTRVIITAGNKVLLVKVWLGAGQWILPGGGIHRGEKPLAAAVREVMEETGLRLDPVALKTLDAFAVKEYGFRFICTVFVVDLPKPAGLKPQPWEVTQLAWVSLDELQNLSPFTRMLLEKHRKS